ncbi:FCD domain-containing protein [Rathayibacter sp. VKM Ac-2754]|nr:FCD domain-containing protein [Rathayibacter sp. VKM Ac-2754]
MAVVTSSPPDPARSDASTARPSDAVRRMITSGALAPGTRVTEAMLAGVLGTSRSPVREALRVLEQEGLLVSLPNRGVTVVQLTPQDVYEISTLRRTLEEMAVRIGVPVTAPERLRRVESAFELMQEHAVAGREETAAEDSYRFHLAVVGLAGHGRLERAYSSLALQLAMDLNRRARSSRETLIERAERHRPVLQAIRRGDPAAVVEALGEEAALLPVARAGRPAALTPEAAAWFDRARELGEGRLWSE